MASSSSPNSLARDDLRLVAFFGGQLLVGLLVLVALLSVEELVRPSEIIDWITMAIPFGQASLLAGWNALGDGRRLLRPLGSAFFLLVIYLYNIGLIYWIAETRAGGYEVYVAISLIVQWALFQLPLWFARILFDWRIGIPDPHPTRFEPRVVRFGVRHLVAWTTVVAVWLGVARMLGPLVWEHSEAIQFAIFLTCNCLFAWPTVLGCLTTRWVGVGIVAAWGFMVGVTYVEPRLFGAVTGMAGLRHDVFSWLNSVQFVWLVISLLILRRMGYRLIRVSPTADPAV